MMITPKILPSLISSFHLTNPDLDLEKCNESLCPIYCEITKADFIPCETPKSVEDVVNHCFKILQNNYLSMSVSSLSPSRVRDCTHEMRDLYQKLTQAIKTFDTNFQPDEELLIELEKVDSNLPYDEKKSWVSSFQERLFKTPREAFSELRPGEEYAIREMLLGNSYYANWVKEYNNLFTHTENFLNNISSSQEVERKTWTLSSSGEQFTYYDIDCLKENPVFFGTASRIWKAIDEIELTKKGFYRNLCCSLIDNKTIFFSEKSGNIFFVISVDPHSIISTAPEDIYSPSLHFNWSELIPSWIGLKQRSKILILLIESLYNTNLNLKDFKTESTELKSIDNMMRELKKFYKDIDVFSNSIFEELQFLDRSMNKLEIKLLVDELDDFITNLKKEEFVDTFSSLEWEFVRKVFFSERISHFLNPQTILANTKRDEINEINVDSRGGVFNLKIHAILITSLYPPTFDLTTIFAYAHNHKIPILFRGITSR